SLILRIALAAFRRQRRRDRPVRVSLPAHADVLRVLELPQHAFLLVADAAPVSSNQPDKDETHFLVSAANESGSLRTGSLEEHGRALAERMCSTCHAVGKSGESPHVGAPPFRALDRRVE